MSPLWMIFFQGHYLKTHMRTQQHLRRMGGRLQCIAECGVADTIVGKKLFFFKEPEFSRVFFSRFPWANFQTLWSPEFHFGKYFSLDITSLNVVPKKVKTKFLGSHFFPTMADTCPYNAALQTPPTLNTGASVCWKGPELHPLSFEGVPPPPPSLLMHQIKPRAILRPRVCP